MSAKYRCDIGFLSNELHHLVKIGMGYADQRDMSHVLFFVKCLQSRPFLLMRQVIEKGCHNIILFCT